MLTIKLLPIRGHLLFIIQQQKCFVNSHAIEISTMLNYLCFFTQPTYQLPTMVLKSTSFLCLLGSLCLQISIAGSNSCIASLVCVCVLYVRMLFHVMKWVLYLYNCSKDGYTPLSCAAQAGKSGIVRYLLSIGVPIKGYVAEKVYYMYYSIG